MGFDVKKYMKEQGIGYSSNYYSNKLRELDDNVTNYTATDYKRNKEYYTLKRDIAQNVIDQNVYAPNLSRLDDMMENQNEYIEKYGKTGFNSLYSIYKTNAAQDIDNISSIISYKTTGLSSDILNSSTWLANNVTYNETDPDDMLRRAAGVVPASFDAKAIVNYAKEILKQKDENIADEIKSKYAQKETSWENVFPDSKTITTDDIKEAIKIINEHTGETSVDEYRKNLGVIQSVKDNPDMLDYFSPGMRTSIIGVDLENLSAKEAASFANNIKNTFANPPPWIYDREIKAEKDALEAQLTKEYIDDAKVMFEQEKAALPDKYKLPEITDPDYAKVVTAAKDVWKEPDYQSKIPSDYLLLVEKVLMTAQGNNLLEGNTEQEINDALYYIGKGNYVMAEAVINRTANIATDIEDLSRQEEKYLKNAPYKIEKSVAAFELEKRAELAKDFKETAKKYTIGEKAFVDITDDEWMERFKTGRLKGVTNLVYMSDAQKKTYAYYMETDKDKAKEYLDAVSDEINAKRAEAIQQSFDQTAEQKGGKAVLALGSIPYKLASGASLVGAGIDMLSGKPADPNALIYNIGSAGGQMRETALQDLGEGAKFWANVGLSIADFATSYALTGGISGAAGLAPEAGKYITTSLLASQAAGGSAQDVLNRGGTAGEAFLTGTLTGGVEAATELISLGTLDDAIMTVRAMKASGLTKGQMARKIVANIFRQAGAEGGEEIISEIGGNIADIVVNGDNSNYERYIKSLIKDGADEQEARQQAMFKFFGKDVALAFVGGAISGLVVSGGMSAVELVKSQTDVQAAKAFMSDLDNAIETTDNEALKLELTEIRDIIQTATDAYNNTAVMEQIDETSRAEQQRAERDFLKNPVEMTSAEQDYQASKADIAAEQIKAVTEEIEQLKKTSKIKIDKNSTLSETIEMLAGTRADVQSQMQELKDLDMPSISINDLMPNEIRDIGKAIANRSNTVNDLKHTITQINQRIKTARGKAEKSLIKKIKDYRAVKGTTEFKTFMDDWYDAVDTQARSMTDAKAADLQRMRDFAYAVYTQNGLEIPQSVKDGFSRLEKVKVSELSDADIDMINGILDMAKHQSDVETGQANTIKGQTIQQSADAIRDGKAELPVNTKARQGDNYFKSPLTRAHAIGQAFVDTYITPILEGTRTQGENNYWVDTNALNELNKMFQKEFGEHKISKQSQKINDRYVGEHTRAELLALYAIAQDIDGFEALHEKGYDRVVMQTYIKNFQQTYPDLYRGYELMRKVFDYYSYKTNHAYRHINGTDYVTERMLRRNPMYYPLNKDGTYFTAPTADNKTGNKIVPTFTMKRVGGGDIVLANPLWVVKNYAQQANRYVSFAPAVYDATNLTNTEQLHSIFSEMGSDSNGNVIEATYWKDWLTRVAKGNPSIDRVMSKLRSKIAGAKLSLSPTIPLKQAASFYGALKYVDAQYLLNPTVWTRAAQTLVTKEGRSALYQSEPILYDRIHQKQSSLEVGELTGRIFNARAVRAMDALTVTAIYHAVQDMAKAKGIDAQKVYQQALWETQPMYDMAFRSDVQNSETGRWLLMFSTQQYQQQNMMRQIGQDVKQGNYGRAARGTAGLALNVAGFGALSWALFKLLYGKKDEENSLLKEMFNSVFATISPILSRAYSDYELSSTVIDVYNDIVSASKRAFGKAVKGESKEYTWYGVIVSFARPLAEAFGVPLTNAEKWLGRAMSAMIPEFDYDDWKKHESVSDKVKEYVTGESSQYPEQLPEGKSQLNELYFDMVQGKTEGDFERLLELYLEVGDKGKRQNITALLTSIRNKIERELEQENQEYTEEELDRELEKYVDGVLDFFLEDKK